MLKPLSTALSLDPTSYYPGPGRLLSFFRMPSNILSGLFCTRKLADDLIFFYYSRFLSARLYALGPGVSNLVSWLSRSKMFPNLGAAILEKIADLEPMPC